MDFQDLSYLGPVGTQRRVGADGLVVVKCRICERDICKQQYQGFSTAICAVCAESVERGKRPDEIMAAIKEKERKQVEDVYNDLGPAQMKVAGIGQRIKDVVEKVKLAATKRRRKPLLAVKDTEPQ